MLCNPICQDRRAEMTRRLGQFEPLLTGEVAQGVVEFSGQDVQPLTGPFEKFGRFGHGAGQVRQALLAQCDGLGSRTGEAHALIFDPVQKFESDRHSQFSRCRRVGARMSEA